MDVWTSKKGEGSSNLRAILNFSKWNVKMYIHQNENKVYIFSFDWHACNAKAGCILNSVFSFFFFFFKRTFVVWLFLNIARALSVLWCAMWRGTGPGHCFVDLDVDLKLSPPWSCDIVALGHWSMEAWDADCVVMLAGCPSWTWGTRTRSTVQWVDLDLAK